MIYDLVDIEWVVDAQEVFFIGVLSGMQLEFSSWILLPGHV